jgi:hypothetical protein
MRCFFDQDEDFHWYLIPEELAPLWQELKYDVKDGWKDERWCFDDFRIDKHPRDYIIEIEATK